MPDAYSPAVLALSPLAYWKMDDASGVTLADSVIGNYPLTLPTSAAFEQRRLPFVPGGPGIADWAGGGNAYAFRPNTVDLQFTALNSFTLMGWFGSIPSMSGRAVFGCKGFTAAGVEARPWYACTVETSGKARMWLRSAAGVDYIAESFSSLNDAQYIAHGPMHHVVGVFDVAVPEVRIYVDGYLENRTAAAVAAWGTNGDRFELNALNGAGGGEWQGGVAVFDHVVAAADITALYEAGRAGATWYPYQSSQTLGGIQDTLSNVDGKLDLILQSVRRTYT